MHREPPTISRPRPTKVVVKGGEGTESLGPGPVRATRSRSRDDTTQAVGPARSLQSSRAPHSLTCGLSGTGAGGAASPQACPPDEKHLTQRRALPPAKYIRCAAYPNGRRLSQSENGGSLPSDANWSTGEKRRAKS